MKLLAWILIIWLACLIAGSVFGILGKVIWIAILASIIAALWEWLKRSKKNII